jgi:methionine synthase I (cobalamin-dependent)
VSSRLAAALARGPVILDAAMGTRLIAAGLDLTHDDPCLWTLTRPEAVAQIHRRDVSAGSFAVLTNTFGANRTWLSRIGRQRDMAQINHQAATLARGEAGANRAVIGSIGPTAAAGTGAFREQADILIDAGVDALLFETQRAETAGHALAEVAANVRVPVFVSLVAWPDPPNEAVQRLVDGGAAAIGVNCVSGMSAAIVVARALRALTSLPIVIKPNAGNPGEPFEGPESFALAGRELRAIGPVLVGGCCGTGHAHVAALYASCYHDSLAESNDSARSGEG